MIRTIKLDLNAAYPNMPLEPVNVFAGSAASLTLCNVPRSVGDRAITSLALAVSQRTGNPKTYQAVRVGSAYEVTVPAADLSLPFSASLGVRVLATGTDENKSAATWVLGVADLIVLNNQGQVTPGADAGDVKHSEFADLDPDTSSLADVITRLKGSAMSLSLVLTSLLVSLTAVAALPVTPVYTNHNRVAGNVQTMTNLQEWASAVESAIGGTGGVDTNAVKSLIESEVGGTNTLLHTNFPMSEAWTNGVAAVVTNDVGGFTEWECPTDISGQSIMHEAYDLHRTYFTKTYNAEMGWWTLAAKYDGTIGGVQVSDKDAWYEPSRDATNATAYIDAVIPVEFSRKKTFGNALGLAYAKDIPSINGLVTASEATNITHDAVSPVSNKVDYLEGYVAGQRIRVSVTNYYGNTSGDLPRLRIEEFITATNVTDGVETETNYWQVVWDEQNKYDRFMTEATTAIAAMTNNLYQTYYSLLQERLATKAPRAWGTLTSAGEAAPPGTVWQTEPNTVFAGGTEYAHAMVGTGVIGVLQSKGAAAYTDGETGRFHFTTDDKTAFFGMNIATRYELGCATDGITVTAVGGNNMVDLLYNVTMTGKPILYYKTNLVQNAWEQITDSSGGSIPGATVYASWDQSPPAGSEICTINCGSGVSGFFKASIEYAGTSKFETNMMADLAGGIVATNQTSNQMQPVEPYISNGSVMWRVKQ